MNDLPSTLVNGLQGRHGHRPQRVAVLLTSGEVFGTEYSGSEREQGREAWGANEEVVLQGCLTRSLVILARVACNLSGRCGYEPGIARL